MAAFSATSGTVVDAWNPNISNGTVWGVGVLGSTVYVGGGFSGTNSVNGNTTRNRLAAFSATSGTVVSAWDPNVSDNTVYALAVSSTAVYAGGNMTLMNVTARNRAAAIDANGNLTSWNPNINGTVFSLAVSGSGSTTTVYAGGAFNGVNSVNGNTTRNRLAAFDATTGTVVDAWNPNVSAGTDGVTAIAVSGNGNTLYIGGDFTQVGNNGTYARLAAVAATGSGSPITSWVPGPNGKVLALAVSADGNTLYAGGGFTTIGGEGRNRLAALDASTASVSVKTWDPNVSTGTNVQALALSGTTFANTTVYAGGDFSQVNTNVPRNKAAAFDADGAVLTTWNPNLTQNVSAIALSGSTVYLGGWFSGFLKAVDATTAAAVAWNPSVSPSSVNAVVATSTTVYAGGNTISIGAVPGAQYYAAIPATLPPVLASVSWSTFGPSGPIGGTGTLNLVGDGFVAGMTVTVGTNDCPIINVASATAATCTLPSGTAGAKNVVVTTPAGSATLTGGFTYLATPTVTGVTPTFGPPAGGTTITLTGTGFFPWMSAKVDTTACTSIGWISATSITCVTPAGSLGAVDVSVTTAGGTGTKIEGFNYGTAPATPKVTFMPNGGTGSMPVQQSSTPAVLDANTFTPPAGSVFVGWDTASGGGGTSFGAGAVYDFTTSITLYAQWVDTSTGGEVVTFDANGGTGAAAWQRSATAAALTANAFTMTGMVFVGWDTQAGGGGTAYADQDTYSFTASIVLYAQWANTGPSRTVIFNANGGTGSMPVQQSTTPAVLDANTFTPPTGSVFVGWDTVSGSGGTSFGAGAVYDFSVSITLYAQWVSTSSGEVVTFDANGGTGAAAWQQSATAAPLTANAFTRTGMAFAGWNTQAGGGGTAYVDEETYLFATSIVLYAQWASTSAAREDLPLPLFYSIGATNGACPPGWGTPSWQEWPNDGRGGPTCNLIIPWSARLDTWAFDPAVALQRARDWEAWQRALV